MTKSDQCGLISYWNDRNLMEIKTRGLLSQPSLYGITLPSSLLNGLIQKCFWLPPEKPQLLWPSKTGRWQHQSGLADAVRRESHLAITPSTSSIVSGRGLLAVSGSSRVRPAPSSGQRPLRTMGAWGLMFLRRYIMGAKTPPVRAHMDPIPIPFCLQVQRRHKF